MSSEKRTIPRAMIHKRILDAADDDPDASLDELAAEISSADAALVERVLDEYGDPVEETPDNSSDMTDPSLAQECSRPDPNDLSEKQRDVLRAIYEHPDASQRELGDLLDVSGSTVNARVNAIEGFAWDSRQTFAAAVFDATDESESEPPATDSTSQQMSSNGTKQTVQAGELRERISDLERQMDALSETTGTDSAFTDPELVHKIVHACMESDVVDEAEELRILRELLR